MLLQEGRTGLCNLPPSPLTCVTTGRPRVLGLGCPLVIVVTLVLLSSSS